MDIFYHISIIILIISCIFAAIIDIKTRKIPNFIPIFLCVCWVVLLIVRLIFSNFGYLEVSIENIILTSLNNIIGMIIVLLILIFCLLISKKLNKNKKDNHEVFGMGDLKLIALISLYFGLWPTIICMFCSCISFIIYIVFFKILKNRKIISAPFAPFILLGVILTYIIVI